MIQRDVTITASRRASNEIYALETAMFLSLSSREYRDHGGEPRMTKSAITRMRATKQTCRNHLPRRKCRTVL